MTTEPPRTAATSDEIPAISARTGDVKERVTRRWVSLYGMVWIGYWMGNLVPLQLLIPNKLDQIAPASKEVSFATINALSGIVLLVALPLCGALCDRTRVRFGRRRTWLAVGSMLFAVGLVLTGFQSTVVGIGAWWSLSMIGLSAATAGLTAVIADQVPVSQRGLVSSAIYGPQAFGVVIGMGLVSAFALSNTDAYIVIAILLLALTAPFLFVYRDRTEIAVAQIELRAVLTSMVTSMRHKEFAWAFGGRLLVNLGNSLGTCYMLFFIIDALKVSDPASTLLGTTAVYLLAGIVMTAVVGLISDRVGRRKIFVAGAAAAQAIAGLMLATNPTLEVTLVSSALMGGGYGAYMAVDQALVTQVLPAAHSRAKDLGIMNIGMAVPPTVAPLLASVFIVGGGGGYSALFITVGVLAGLGALLTYRVKSVR